MAVVGARESWDAGGLTFDQPSVGTTGDTETEDVWDDRAILKAFDDALNTHTRKPVDEVEARKWNKHAAQEVAAQPSTAGSRLPMSAPSSPRGRTGSNKIGGPSSSTNSTAAAAYHHDRRSVDGGQSQSHNQGFQAADRRFASLLAKGNAEASSEGGRAPRTLPAGIPGPWQPVAGPSEGAQYSGATPQDGGGQRYGYGRPGPSDPYQWGPEYSGGAHGFPYPSRGAPQHPPPHPPSGAAVANFEEGGPGRHGLPPPPQPPHPEAGPHAAAFQSLDGVHDDDLADLLLAWYYSGYYTGRYRAMQESRRTSNYRRYYAPPPTMPPTRHGGWHGGSQHGGSQHGGSQHGGSHYGSHHGGGGGAERWGGESNGG